jgi:hypothetical protein
VVARNWDAQLERHLRAAASWSDFERIFNEGAFAGSRFSLDAELRRGSRSAAQLQVWVGACGQSWDEPGHGQCKSYWKPECTRQTRTNWAPVGEAIAHHDSSEGAGEADTNQFFLNSTLVGVCFSYVTITAKFATTHCHGLGELPPKSQAACKQAVASAIRAAIFAAVRFSKCTRVAVLGFDPSSHQAVKRAVGQALTAANQARTSTHTRTRPWDRGTPHPQRTARTRMRTRTHSTRTARAHARARARARTRTRWSA